jgi:hypothetical protein
MKSKRRIFIMIGLILICLYGIRLLTFQPLAPCVLIDGGITDEFKDLSVENSTKFETKGSITGIDICLNGNINGNGILTIGSSDTTVYRQFTLASGKIDIHHSSDWYSEICMVKYTPQGKTTGDLTISCNFTGDELTTKK